MFRLYHHLNERTTAPTTKEIDIAAGRVQLSFQEANTYVTDLEKKTADIVDALRHQTELTNVST